MLRTTRFGFNVAIALTIILALAVSAWGAAPAAALQSPDRADFTTAVSESAGGSGQSLVQAVAPDAAQVGERVTFTLRSAGADGLAGFQFAVRYDDRALDFASAEIAPEWKAAGYDLIQMGPVQYDGVVYFGAVACPVGDCTSSDYQQPKLSLKSLPVDVPLANFNFFVRAAGTHAFTVSEAKMVNEQGLAVDGPQAAAQTDLKALDLTRNGFINDSDASDLIREWELLTERGQCIAPSLTRYDLDGSGCLDAADAQMILNYWGTDLLQAAAAPEVSPNAASAITSTFVVNSNGDGSDQTLGDGKCETSTGSCTLRAAVEESNLYPGTDRIEFNVRGPANTCPALVVIQIAPSAESITVDDKDGDGVVIDGYTQCNASPNNQAVSGNAVIKVEIRGDPSNPTAGLDGIKIASQNNTVRGLAIYGFQEQIAVRGGRAFNNSLEGNFLGTNAAETSTTNVPSGGPQSNGIDFGVNASNNVVGGVSPTNDKRNLISGNDQDGINIQGSGVHDIVVINNYIGLKQDGVNELRNSHDGVDIAGGAYNNRIGGLNPGERNVIGGNYGDGIEISHEGVHDNFIEGNWIGLQADGSGTTGNRERGVTFEDMVTNNTVRRNIIVGNGGYGVRFYTASDNSVLNNFIGAYPPGMTLATVVPNPSTSLLNTLVKAGNGTRPTDQVGMSGVFALGGSQNNLIKGNVITDHPEYGVQISPEHGYLNTNGSCETYYNTISENWIFENGQQGIRLTSIVNPTDCAPGTYIGNQGIAAPVFTSATNRQVAGTACANCTVEVFLSDKTEVDTPSDNYGEGRVFLARGVANASGQFSINISGVTGGQIVTATATSASGNTSEFARNTIAISAPSDVGDHTILLPLVVR